VSEGVFSLLAENTIVLGGGLVDDDTTHTVQAGVPPVSRQVPYHKQRKI